jgi:hypothetical protein
VVLILPIHPQGLEREVRIRPTVVGIKDIQRTSTIFTFILITRCECYSLLKVLSYIINAYFEKKKKKSNRSPGTERVFLLAVFGVPVV